jgi:hypothetical protein
VTLLRDANRQALAYFYFEEEPAPAAAVVTLHSTTSRAFIGRDARGVNIEWMRVALAKCEAIFRLQEPKKRMKDQAAHACRALCRARVADELQRRRGTRIGEQLKLVLSIIDRQVQ